MRIVATVVTLGFATAVCGACVGPPSDDGAVAEPTFEDTCPRGLTRPFAVGSVIRIARRHGFSLQRETECDAYIGDVENVSNAVDTTGEEYDEITSREGHVMCSLGDHPPPYGALRVQRTKYPEDEETYFDVGNVSCAVYPERPEHIERLRRALEAVARGPTVRRGCPRGTPAPIGYERLVRSARAHGIELLRDERCIAPGVIAQASNVLVYLPYTETGPQWDQIEFEQGHVTCLLRAGGGPPAVDEEQATVTTRLRYRNVECWITPLGENELDQVDALRAVFEDLSGG